MLSIISWFWENAPISCIKFVFIVALFGFGKIYEIIDGIRQERRKREIEKYREFWRNL